MTFLAQNNKATRVLPAPPHPSRRPEWMETGTAPCWKGSRRAFHDVQRARASLPAVDTRALTNPVEIPGRRPEKRGHGLNISGPKRCRQASREGLCLSRLASVLLHSAGLSAVLVRSSQ